EMKQCERQTRRSHHRPSDVDPGHSVGFLCSRENEDGVGLRGTRAAASRVCAERRVTTARDGVSWSVQVGNKFRIEGKGAKGLNPEAAPLQLANTGHPAADTFNLAHASNSHVAGLGLAWDDRSGATTRNTHPSPGAALSEVSQPQCTQQGLAARFR